MMMEFGQALGIQDLMREGEWRVVKIYVMTGLRQVVMLMGSKEDTDYGGLVVKGWRWLCKEEDVGGWRWRI